MVLTKEEAATVMTPARVIKSRTMVNGSAFATLNLRKQQHSEMQPSTIYSRGAHGDDLEALRAENNHTAQEAKRTKKLINKNDIDDLNNRLIESPISPAMKRARTNAPPSAYQTPGTKASTPLI